ncbi:MAG: addiction module toxin, HicA family [Deltaproteobacteria bacterium]|nr:addiction module toxin, HicA family [Deltaproteobacteria bacterium]
MPRLAPVHWRELEKVVLRLGLQFARQKGSHRSYVRSGLSRPVIIPVRSEILVQSYGISWTPWEYREKNTFDCSRIRLFWARPVKSLDPLGGFRASAGMTIGASREWVPA